MMTDRELDEILAELARDHRAVVAPARLEPLLRAAAGSRKPTAAVPAIRSTWVWATAVILLAAVAGVIFESRRNHQPQSQLVRSLTAPPVRREPMPPSALVAAGPSVPSPRIPLRSAPVRGAAADRPRLPDPFPQEATWSSLDEFVPLPVSEGLPPAAELSVVRVKLRGSDLRQYGLETPPDAVAQPMLAEFVVGEDGLPRAIRIVR